jgi:hypothetical protein
MGPILTDEEIEQIYMLAGKKDKFFGKDCYRSQFRCNRPNLIEMKMHWSVATLSRYDDNLMREYNFPQLGEKSIDEMSEEEKLNKINRGAVKKLAKMRG